MFSNWLIYSPCFSIAFRISFNVYYNGVLIFPPGTLFTWPARRLLLVILMYIQLLIFLLVSDTKKKISSIRIPPIKLTQRQPTYSLLFVDAVSPSTDIMTTQRSVCCWHLQRWRCQYLSPPICQDDPPIQLIKKFNTPLQSNQYIWHRSSSTPTRNSS